MKDEIKEILDELNWYLKQPNNQDINGEYEPPMELSQEEAKEIYDCITNLQEENERLKKDLKILWNVCWNNDTEMTSYQNEVFDNYYDMFHKNGGDEE